MLNLHSGGLTLTAPHPAALLWAWKGRRSLQMLFLTTPREGAFLVCASPSLLVASARQNRNPQMSQPASLLQSHKLQSSDRLRVAQNLSPVPWAGTPEGWSTEEAPSKHRLPASCQPPGLPASPAGQKQILWQEPLAGCPRFLLGPCLCV